VLFAAPFGVARLRHRARGLPVPFVIQVNEPGLTRSPVASIRDSVTAGSVLVKREAEALLVTESMC
jgi:hypothetical protein